MADDAATQTQTETTATAPRRRRRRDVKPASFGEASGPAGTPLEGFEPGQVDGDDDPTMVLEGTPETTASGRKRDTRKGDRHRNRPPGKAVTEGATVVYTLLGTGFQMVGLVYAGYAMQAQADTAGPKLGRWAMTHPRAKGLFERVGTGSDLAPLIAGPLLAEAYVRSEALRPRLAPMLGLLLPQDASDAILGMFPPPDLVAAQAAAEAQAAADRPSGVPDEPLPDFEGVPAPADVDRANGAAPPPADAPAGPRGGASKRRAGAGVRAGGEAAA